jgi:hypothetical protein
VLCACSALETPGGLTLMGHEVLQGREQVGPEAATVLGRLGEGPAGEADSLASEESEEDMRGSVEESDGGLSGSGEESAGEMRGGSDGSSSLFSEGASAEEEEEEEEEGGGEEKPLRSDVLPLRKRVREDDGVYERSDADSGSSGDNELEVAAPSAGAAAGRPNVLQSLLDQRVVAGRRVSAAAVPRTSIASTRRRLR